MNQIHVLGGSVQFRLAVSKRRDEPKDDDPVYLVDVWKDGRRWMYTTKLEGSREFCGKGERYRWSDARTAAFRASIQHAKGES